MSGRDPGTRRARSAVGALGALLAACGAVPPPPAPPPAPAPAQAPAPAATRLEGPAWTLVSLDGQPVPDLPLARTPLIRLRDGRVDGSSGCNRISGSYTVDGPRLRFGPMAGTRMACAEGMDLEARVLAALPRVTHWRVPTPGADSLEALGDAGAVVARFEIRLQRYRCSDGSTLLARYAPQAARVAVGGREYTMHAVRTGSGAHYATEQGRKPDWSLHWWTWRDEGTLSEAPLDDSIRPGDRKPFATCQRD